LLVKVILLFTSIMMVSTAVDAHDYAVEVDSSAWFVEPTPLSCRLRQDVAHYGRVVFEKLSGKDQNFKLSTLRHVPQAGVVEIEAITPVWRHPYQSKSLARVKGSVGVTPVQVGDNLASTLLNQLLQGMEPVFTHAGWEASHSVSIKASPVNFSEAYSAYLDCINQLFPVGFETVERTSILFDTDKSNVKKLYKKRLKLVVDYMALDPEVNAIYVDGHTDEIGRRGYNWDLSQRRSESVRKVLLELGVPDDQIIVRYHGETMPIAANFPTTERSKNRRVTLRLDRENL